MAGTVQLDDRGVIVECAGCAKKNRLAYARLGDSVQCGECKKPLSAPGTPIELATLPRDGIQPHRYVPCTARARHELGLQQRISLNEAVARTIDWLRQSDRSPSRHRACRIPPHTQYPPLETTCHHNRTASSRSLYF